MKLFRLFVCCLLVAITFLSCKDDAKNPEEASKTGASNSTEGTVNAEDPKEQKVIGKSVLEKLFVTPEAKTFSRYIISAGLTDLFSKNEGPFTLIVPSNSAFEGLPKSTIDSLSYPQNKAMVIKLIKDHLVEGDLSSAELLQSAKKNGTYTLRTMSGTNLTVYVEDGEIKVKDSKGGVAMFGKSDIIASNGKVHLIDAVMNATK